jgi:signal transduction histidine kinase
LGDVEFTPAADPPQRPGIDRLRRARLLHDRTGRVVQVGTPAAVVVVFAASLEADPRPGLTGTNLLVLGALSVFVLACGVALYGTAVRRLRLIAAALALVAALTLSFVQTAGVGMLGVGVAGCVLLGLVSPRLGRIAVPCAVVLVVATSLLHPPVFSRTFLSILAVGVVVVLITVAQRMRAAVDEAEHLLVATERSRRAEEAAVLHERQQLAREMHDVLAHSLSGLALQLEGARLLAADRDTDSAVVAVIERAQSLTRSGLDDARRAIGLLRDDDLPGSDRLGDLVRTFTQDTGIPCTLSVEGERRPLPATAELTLYRVTQEALTNVVRHADAGRVDVDLRYGPQHVRLRVADRPDGAAGDGAAPDGGAPATSSATVSTEPGGGHGLTGMRERAALLGGTLTARPADRGFVVELEVPA